jgi:hypothetical protein
MGERVFFLAKRVVVCILHCCGWAEDVESGVWSRGGLVNSAVGAQSGAFEMR